jgi:hypothetical protein
MNKLPDGKESILGFNIGFIETLTEEFKEFTIKTDVHNYFSKEEVKEIISKSSIKIKDNFNKMAIDNIHYYINFYLPKYISAFANSDLEKGSMYLGINDIGEITGIPFYGELTREMLLPMIDEISVYLSKDLGIHFEIIKLETVLEILDDNLDQIIKEKYEKMEKQKKDYEDYIKRKVKWVEEIYKYYIKVSDFANIRFYRDLVIDYIKWNSGPVEFIELLTTDDYIDIGDTDEIGKRKQDTTDIIHWITMCKDTLLQYVYKKKPEPVPYYTYHDNIHEHHFRLLTTLRSKFVRNGMSYYMIKFDFQTKEKETIYYRHGKEWKAKERVIYNGEPACVILNKN